MIDVALCLRTAADCLAAARFCHSEADVAREYADVAIPELSTDLAALVDDALVRGDWRTLDQIANALEPPAVPVPQPKPRRRRKPSLARLVTKAKKLGVDVTIDPDGAATFRTGATASATADSPQAELDEWIAKHAH